MKFHLIFLLLMTLLSLRAQAEIAIIVHPQSPIARLSLNEVSDLYLGRTRKVGSDSVMVLEHHDTNPVRERFFLKLNGMDLSRVNAYWARLQFSGNLQSPLRVRDDKAMLEVVRRNRHAIGYVDAALISDDVRTIGRLAE